MKHTSENITRIILYSISVNRSLSPKSHTLNLWGPTEHKVSLPADTHSHVLICHSTWISNRVPEPALYFWIVYWFDPFLCAGWCGLCSSIQTWVSVEPSGWWWMLLSPWSLRDVAFRSGRPIMIQHTASLKPWTQTCLWCVNTPTA